MKHCNYTTLLPVNIIEQSSYCELRCWNFCVSGIGCWSFKFSRSWKLSFNKPMSTRLCFSVRIFDALRYAKLCRARRRPIDGIAVRSIVVWAHCGMHGLTVSSLQRLIQIFALNFHVHDLITVSSIGSWSSRLSPPPPPPHPDDAVTTGWVHAVRTSV